jgi:hypothetical protein
MYFEWEGEEMRFGGSMERKDGEEGQEREKKKGRGADDRMKERKESIQLRGGRGG